MTDLDEKLFASHTRPGYAEAEWREILAHVIRKMERFLEQPVAVHQIDFYADGFAGDISSKETFAGSLKLSWFGRIGVSVVGAKEATVLQAFLFLHGADQRLVAIDGNAYLWLHYQKQTTGNHEWAMQWQLDEFGEFETWGVK